MCFPPTSDARRPVRRPGFTLVELLVVIGIIALLVGLLLPSLSKARETAKRTACAAKLQQIMVAATTHRSDHKDYYPLAGMLTGAFPLDLEDPDTQKYDYVSIALGQTDPRQLAPITLALGKEMGFKDILLTTNAAAEPLADDPKGLYRNFLCPSQADSIADIQPTKPNLYYVVQASTTGGAGIGTSYIARQSYIYNEYVLGYDDSYARLRGHATKVRQPASTMFAADGLSSSYFTGRAGDAKASVPTLYNLITRAPVTVADAFVSRAGYAGDATCFDKVRHQGKINVAFCDGHVETRSLTSNDLRPIYLMAP